MIQQSRRVWAAVLATCVLASAALGCSSSAAMDEGARSVRTPVGYDLAREARARESQWLIAMLHRLSLANQAVRKMSETHGVLMEAVQQAADVAPERNAPGPRFVMPSRCDAHRIPAKERLTGVRVRLSQLHAQYTNCPGAEVGP